MDYAVMIGLFGISTAVVWRVVFVLTRGIERSLKEFKTLTNERFDRQDERFDRQGERLERQGALIVQLVREVGLLTGVLMGTPGKRREKVGSREYAFTDGGRGRHRNDKGPMRTRGTHRALVVGL
ncbi:MAG: hypothetical protein F4X18_03425 [Acidimicrobiia bacterium]|nr:hypothetical protein [Acidimicrobiia bacterium]